MNKYLLKIAEATGLEQHQKDALNKLEKSHGIILDHSTGSGKTKTFLTAAESTLRKNKDGRVFIAAPASLTSNIDKEIKKHGLKIDMSRVDVMSYEEAANRSEKLRKNRYLLAIADEGHKLRNEGTKRHKELSDIISHADRRIIATATPSYNKPSDIAPLVNMAAGKNVLETGAKFDNRYITTHKEAPSILKRILGAQPKEVKTLKNREDLGESLKKYVHHYDASKDPKARDKFPSKQERIVDVPMSSGQEHVYKYMEGKLPWHIRMKVHMNLPMDKKDSAALNAFSSGVRQASNSTRPFGGTETTPKIHTAVARLKHRHDSDPNFRGVVYSNYLDAGLNDYAAELKKHNISHAIYHGGLSKKEKDAIRDGYNNGKIKTILASSSGSEGLDLKGTKLVQVLDPHFNESKIDQVKGRGVRYESHAHLPEEERHVEIERYHSIFPKQSIFGGRKHSIDEYLYHNSSTKSDLSKEMRDLYKD